ncbi:hypothetical protein GCM10010503_48760 [Streptomyces lucensis JCM 4490]|uniref:Uncharacterized protein n=1 Tax=Streptomyces lucensis JCM 4490 TaxID=1306176 RepID=A0A918J9N0_9ACTN|nr:hypothetical protein [Streptomyces lucensis]GGW65814.1 hypothetical protein GCM10010503_48760 [Streptomyces lucensis JCM 4490]
MGESLRKILLWGRALQEWWSDRLGKEIVSIWAAGIVLGVPAWIIIEIFWHPDSILGDGGLAAFGLLIILAVTTLFAWTGVMIVRETIAESRVTAVRDRSRSLTIQVLTAGAAGWAALRAILVFGHHVSTTVGLVSAIPLAAPYSLAFLALVTRGDARWRVVRAVLPAPIALVVLLRFV